jgi:hypothetical protein
MEDCWRATELKRIMEHHKTGLKQPTKRDNDWYRKKIIREIVMKNSEEKGMAAEDLRGDAEWLPEWKKAEWLAEFFAENGMRVVALAKTEFLLAKRP